MCRFHHDCTVCIHNFWIILTLRFYKLLQMYFMFRSSHTQFFGFMIVNSSVSYSSSKRFTEALYKAQYPDFKGVSGCKLNKNLFYHFCHITHAVYFSKVQPMHSEKECFRRISEYNENHHCDVKLVQYKYCSISQFQLYHCINVRP